VICSPVILLIPYGRRARNVGCRTSGREELEQRTRGHWENRNKDWCVGNTITETMAEAQGTEEQKGW